MQHISQRDAHAYLRGCTEAAEMRSKLTLLIARWQAETYPDDPDDADSMDDVKALAGDRVAWDICQELREILGLDRLEEPTDET